MSAVVNLYAFNSITRDCAYSHSNGFGFFWNRHGARGKLWMELSLRYGEQGTYIFEIRKLSSENLQNNIYYCLDN